MNFLINVNACFMGSVVTRKLIARCDVSVCLPDKLTHAGDLASLQPVAADPCLSLIKADICAAVALHDVFARTWADRVIHHAA